MLRKEERQKFDIAAHQRLEHGVFFQGANFPTLAIQEGPVIAQEGGLETRPPQRTHMLIALRIMHVVGAGKIKNAACGNPQQLLLLGVIRIQANILADAETLHVGI